MAGRKLRQALWYKKRKLGLSKEINYALFRYRGTAASRYGFVSHEPPDYMNILPEEKRLAEVSSNIWGTKFKIVGVSLNFLPQNLGQINYKASLLHLQPRQMTLEIIDLNC